MIQARSAHRQTNRAASDARLLTAPDAPVCAWPNSRLKVALLFESVKLPKHLRVGWRMRSRASIFFTVVVATTLLDGLAPVLAASHDTPVASAPGDPWERQDRRDHAIEGALDRHAIGPVARFYHKVTPGPIGRGIHNVLSEPVVIINDLLQLGRPLHRARFLGRRRGPSDESPALVGLP